jgi:predicted Zn-dependent protease
MFGQQPSGGGGFKIPPTLIIAAVMAAFTLLKYCSSATTNPLTGETQYINVSPEQEIAMGLESRGPMSQEFGGVVQGTEADALVKKIGRELVEGTIAKQSPYKYEFHLLADNKTINAFALPGGQVFITVALLSRLENEDQLAGVLGHEIGHVIARHSAQRISQMELAQGLTGAVSMATYSPGNPNSGYIAQTVANMIGLKYGRDQELQSDDLGVRLMLETGRDPMQLLGVMEILKQASGGKQGPEYQSSHPDPENRKEKILESIQKYSRK